MKSQYDILNINGIPLHVAFDGPKDAPALIFAHALSLNLRSFELQATHFRHHYRVIRLDLRGHGKTGGGSFSMSDLAGDIVGLLEHLGIQRTHFVGSSLGAMIGMTLALEHRERLTSLTFMASQGALPPERIAAVRKNLDAMRASGAKPETTLTDQTEAMLARLLGEIEETEAPETFALLRLILSETTLFGQARAYEAIIEMNYDGRLAEITTPTLIIAGSEDASTPPARMQMYAEGIAGARMVILDGAGHFPNVEKPDPFNDALATFLESVDG
ncbi:MAG: alpha/beta fold hydrolase [Pseudomonadota bacterium]|nr:alpha/beta fold hydrolase [Pseudomonadota bacterium]